MIEISINNKLISCFEGESILHVARKNGIFIPALCYLSNSSPTLACRLCMVEANGKIVYSCNAKVKDGAKILTHTREINEARNAIMQAYCVNHPLECGVCNKSGECDLQNLALHTKISSQNFYAKNSFKKPENWGFITYEPSLCIACERCVKVCKDKLGTNALKVISQESEISLDLKQTMPKDAYAVLSRTSKNLITRTDESDNGIELGECAAVCPVGALTLSHFFYTTNAWELRKIPASNPHSSDCELIFYEVKRSCIQSVKPKIYRVSNDYEFGEINAAARFGFDFQNEVNRKDTISFSRIISKLNNSQVKRIKFNSFITNEEAYILSKFKQNLGVKLINEEARIYQKFLRNFSEFCGTSLYNGNLEKLKNADFIVVCGSFLRSDSPNCGYKINNALKMNKANGLYFHALGDKMVQNYSKNFICVRTEPQIDIQILLWILQNFANGDLGEDLARFLKENYEICPENSAKTSKFAKILGINESEILALCEKKEKFMLVIGEDFYYSKNAEILASLAGLVQKFTPFEIILIPPRTNSLGVALLCELDDETDFCENLDENLGENLTPKEQKFTFGYNEKGDFTFSVFGGDLDAPALNQQEGTFCNIDRRVVPTNAALPHAGYELNDIANALDLGEELCVDFTQRLSDNAHFELVKFDSLSNFYDNGGKNCRGYELKTQNLATKQSSEVVKKLTQISLYKSAKKGNKITIYRANPIWQFSKFTNRCHLLNETGALWASDEFLQTHHIEENSSVIIQKGEIRFAIIVKLDKNLIGEIAYLTDFDEKIPVWEIFESRFCEVEILKENDE